MLPLATLPIVIPHDKQNDMAELTKLRPSVSRARLILKDLRHLKKVALTYMPFTLNPEQLQVIITDRCNYRCPTCSKWHEQKAEGELATKQWKVFFTEAASLPSSKRVVFGGGEPLLRSDVVELVGHVATLGLNSVMGTNGSLLDQLKLRELQDEGLDYLMVSLNALDSDVHDQTRGANNSFQQVMETLDSYNACRKTMKLGIATIIMECNLHHILRLVDFVTERKLHGIIFQAYMADSIHRPFRWENNPVRDITWDKGNPYAIKNYEQLDEIVDALLLRQRKGAQILNPPSQLRAMKAYYRDPAARYHERRCTAGVTSFLVDPYGNVRICFLSDPIGNISTQKPLEIWRSPNAAEIRRQILQCRDSCRIMNRNY